MNWRRLCRQVGKVGYLATHFDARLKKEYLESTGLTALKERRCEIQIRTLCQDLWSVMAHSLSYKPIIPIPAELNRMIHLLAAMLEVADRSFSDIQEKVQNLPGTTDMELLRVLERIYFRFVGKQYDFQLSQEAVSHLKKLYKEEELNQFASLIESFVDRNESKLRHIYDIYSNRPEAALFLFQPEGLLILERLESDAHMLEQAWVDRFPRSELQSLCTAWGQPLD